MGQGEVIWNTPACLSRYMLRGHCALLCDLDAIPHSPAASLLGAQFPAHKDCILPAGQRAPAQKVASPEGAQHLEGLLASLCCCPVDGGDLRMEFQEPCTRSFEPPGAQPSRVPHICPRSCDCPCIKPVSHGSQVQHNKCICQTESNCPSNHCQDHMQRGACGWFLLCTDCKA